MAAEFLQLVAALLGGGGMVVAEVSIQIEGGQTIVSTISLASVDRMKLKEGDVVTAFIKASEVIVGK